MRPAAIYIVTRRPRKAGRTSNDRPAGQAKAVTPCPRWFCRSCVASFRSMWGTPGNRCFRREDGTPFSRQNGGTGRVEEYAHRAQPRRSGWHLGEETGEALHVADA